MPRFFSLNMPARVYNIPIINDEISRKVEEINATSEQITLLRERIQNAIELLLQYNTELLTMYLQEQRGVLEQPV